MDDQGPRNLTCRSCHQSSQAGGLSIDHALREESTCTLCHDIAVKPGASGGAAPLPSLLIASPELEGDEVPSASPGG